jgi:hypothetical protein
MLSEAQSSLLQVVANTGQSKFLLFTFTCPEQSAYGKLGSCNARCSGILDIYKAGIFHQFQYTPDRDGPPDSLGPCFKTPGNLIRKVFFQDDVSELETSSLFEDPVNFLKTFFFQRGEIQHTI